VSEPATSRDEGRSIPVGIGTAILLFGFILQFFSVRQSLPVEIQIVSAVFVGFTAFLFVVWVWYPPIVHYWGRKRLAGQEDGISRESLGTFQSYVECLRTICMGQGMVTMLYPLQNLKSQNEFSKLPDLNPWIYFTQSLTMQLAGLFNRVEVTKMTFTWAVDTFTYVLSIFNDSVNRLVNEARLIAEQKPVPRAIREDYNTHRQTYIRFLDDYSSFVDGLNKKFRTREITLPGGQPYTETALRPVYAEKPKEL